MKDFIPAAFGSSGPPAIPCTDGTNHSLWFDESDFPLVITDDYYQVDPAFVANMKMFDWCNGANIIVIDNYGAETRMRKLDWEVMKTAAVDRKSLNIVPSDYSQEDLDEYSNSRQPSDVYHRMQSIMDKVGEQ